MRILIVEDDPDQRRLLELVVRQHGHEACACATAAEARAAPACDLAFVDRRLPDGDGLALARALSGRIYLLTGSEPAPGEAEGLGVLHKPVRPAELAGILAG